MLKNENRSTTFYAQEGESPFGSALRNAQPLRSDVTDGDAWGATNGRGLIAPLSPATQSPTRPRPPEILLLEAVLMEAIRSVQGSRRGLSRQDFLDAHAWIASERRDWPFSFRNICDHLELDATAMRRRLGVNGAHADNGHRRHQPWLERGNPLQSSTANRSAPEQRRAAARVAMYVPDVRDRAGSSVKNVKEGEPSWSV